jgi:hypothetical protein
MACWIFLKTGFNRTIILYPISKKFESSKECLMADLPTAFSQPNLNNQGVGTSPPVKKLVRGLFYLFALYMGCDH